MYNVCIDALSGLWHSVLIRLKLFRAALRRLKLIFEVPTTVFHVLSFSTKLLGCIISIFSAVFTVGTLTEGRCYAMSSNRLSWLIFYRFNVSIIPFLESNILEIIEFSKRSCKRQNYLMLSSWFCIRCCI